MPLEFKFSHPWSLTVQQATRLQEELSSRVVVQPFELTFPLQVGGGDVSFSSNRAIAAVVVVDYQSGSLLKQVKTFQPIAFPYIPGLLSFREAPALLTALGELDRLPDILLVDGHGQAHPRRFGLACHLGVLLDLPVVGCAKSRLVGQVDELGEEVGSRADLTVEGNLLGVALRTRAGAKPIYVSIGHRVDLPSAIQIVLGCVHSHRLPEPLRLAHNLATDLKAQL